MPASRYARLEAEFRLAHDVGQRPVGIVDDVGREAEDAAGLEDARQLAERRRRDEAALVVARLRPGVGIEQIDLVEQPSGQLHQQLQRVVGEEPDIADPLGIDLLHELCDAAGKHLGADVAGRRDAPAPAAPDARRRHSRSRGRTASRRERAPRGRACPSPAARSAAPAGRRGTAASCPLCSRLPERRPKKARGSPATLSGWSACSCPDLGHAADR